MTQPQQLPPPALLQEMQNLFESPSVAFTAVVSLRDQCILYQESAHSYFTSHGRTRLDGSTNAPLPPSSKEVDHWLAAACGAASPFLESDASPSMSGDGDVDAPTGWVSASFTSAKWDVIAYRCNANISRDEAAGGSLGGGGAGQQDDVQQHQLLMVTFRGRVTNLGK